MERTVEREGGYGRIVYGRPEFELHLSPAALPRGIANEIRAMGGRVSECRGYSYKRFVHVPFTARGIVLVDLLLGGDGPSTVVLRGFPRMRDLVCSACPNAERALERLRKVARAEHEADALPKPKRAAAAAEARRAFLLKELEAYKARVLEIEAELSRGA